MKNLPWKSPKGDWLSPGAAAILFALPLLFFVSSSLLVLFTTSTLLISSSGDEFIAPSTAGSAIFVSPPPEEVVLGESTVGEKARPIILRDFLASYHSPLVPYANLILEISEKYGLDWRLLTAISGNESLFGRKTPERTYLNPLNLSDPECYNAWGWGVHSRGTLCFSNWEEGIEAVARGLRKNYLDQGLVTIEQIMTRYAPVSVANGAGWDNSINFFMERLENAEYYRQ
ncbi:MAG: hypothetical protein Q8L46_00265 [candidate division WWE3 bacterium]|nr:hypothetical protein [candidate division WWE3 bacterium]